MAQVEGPKMRRSLCIGICSLTPEWSALLDQLGVWYEEVSESKKLFERYSLIIDNENENNAAPYSLIDYLNQGGNVLYIEKDNARASGSTSARKYFKRVHNDRSNEGLHHIPYMDLYTRVNIYEKALFSGLVASGKEANTNEWYLGFDPSELMFRTDYTRKPFASPLSEPPNEIVSKVSKGEISDFFLRLLMEIHFISKLPFIRKWISPTKKPIFCFRIDSDFSDKAHVNKVYDILNNNEINASWFLHVQAHENWLSHFGEFKGQEIALHGYEHGMSRSSAKISENIKKGLNKLTNEGFEVNGYCAPYGIYNQALKESLDQFDFKYTSEFSFAYDSLPLGFSNKPYQIPIHPICTGSLKRKNYSIDSMLGYFNQVIDKKLSRNKPIIFYHHPLQTGLEIFDSIFRRVKNEDLVNLTFIEYADFWQKREACNFEAYYQNDIGYLENVTDCSQLFEIFFHHESSKIIDSKQGKFETLDKSSITYNTEPDLNTKTVGSEIDYISKLKLLKTSILDYRNRKRL